MLTVVVLVSAVATALAFHGGMRHETPEAAPIRHADVQDSPMSTAQGSERESVPDACQTLSPTVAERLAPGADRTVMSQAAQSDLHSECAWGQYGAARSRQLTVELRAMTAQGGASATDVAMRTFDAEWKSDQAGKGLTASATVRESHSVGSIGEEAYVVYTVDTGDEVGEAVANIRLANVLVTVHYSGGDDRATNGRPLSATAATDGALTAAEDVVAELESHA